MVVVAEASPTIAPPFLIVAVAARATVTHTEAFSTMTVGVAVTTILMLPMLTAAEPAVAALVPLRIGGSATR